MVDKNLPSIPHLNEDPAGYRLYWLDRNSPNMLRVTYTPDSPEEKRERRIRNLYFDIYGTTPPLNIPSWIRQTLELRLYGRAGAPRIGAPGSSPLDCIDKPIGHGRRTFS